mgnify:CR=1 FL=1
MSDQQPNHLPSASTPNNGPTFNNKPNIGRTVRIGLIIVLGFVVGFSLWSTLSPIESATVANGIAKVVGSRRTIQHLEGGIIKKIYI